MNLCPIYPEIEVKFVPCLSRASICNYGFTKKLFREGQLFHLTKRVFRLEDVLEYSFIFYIYLSVLKLSYCSASWLLHKVHLSLLVLTGVVEMDGSLGSAVSCDSADDGDTYWALVMSQELWKHVMYLSLFNPHNGPRTH